MIKFNTIILFSFTIIISSCKNNSTIIEDKEVDSVEIRQSSKQTALNKILDQERPDFILDSLNLEYTIDGQKIINKKVLVELDMIKDIYENKDSTKHVLIKGGFHNYIDLVCSSEQIKILRDADYKIKMYLIINPLSVKKIDFQYLSSVDADVYDEGEKPSSKIEIDDFIDNFMIKGKLLNIRSVGNE